MKPVTNSRSGGRETNAGTGEDTKNKKKVPNADMQPEDAGTEESGAGGRGNASDTPMTKTPRESGGSR